MVKSFLKLTSTEEEAVKAYFMCYVKDQGESLILNKIERAIDFFEKRKVAEREHAYRSYSVAL